LLRRFLQTFKTPNINAQAMPQAITDISIEDCSGSPNAATANANKAPVAAAAMIPAAARAAIKKSNCFGHLPKGERAISQRYTSHPHGFRKRSARKLDDVARTLDTVECVTGVVEGGR
jgi:hypothetical protein